MPRSSTNPWLHRFAMLTAGATLALIGIGGLVTSHEAGMAVPDWPNSYGYNMFLFPVSNWMGGIFYEHSHRLAASMVGLLTTILCAWLWIRETRSRERWIGFGLIVAVILLMGFRQLPVFIALAAAAAVAVVFSLLQIRRQPTMLRWWGVMAFGAVILQGVLGGLRVVWFKDEIGIFHAVLAQLFLALLWAIALFTSQWWQNDQFLPGSIPAGSRLRQLMLIASLMILGQLVLGATMRHQHAGLAIPDFPLAYGKVWPALDPQSIATYNQQRKEVIALNSVAAFQIGLQMVHRILALLIFCSVCASAWIARKALSRKHPLAKLTLVWAGLLCLQVILGAATIWSTKAADIATLHVVVGALSLAAGLLLTTVSWRRLKVSIAPLVNDRAIEPVFRSSGAAAAHPNS
jgi:cytochrome c oxidase assembly protein subunit 15